MPQYLQSLGLRVIATKLWYLQFYRASFNGI